MKSIASVAQDNEAVRALVASGEELIRGLAAETLKAALLGNTNDAIEDEYEDAIEDGPERRALEASMVARCRALLGDDTAKAFAKKLEAKRVRSSNSRFESSESAPNSSKMAAKAKPAPEGKSQDQASKGGSSAARAGSKHNKKCHCCNKRGHLKVDCSARPMTVVKEFGRTENEDRDQGQAMQ
eukprot:Amastigsp_a677504_11.p2 type:complete len:184 gc:universal Amastigsp_a677504_11:698-147(-)